MCALGQIRACCCQGKFQSSPCARWVPFSAQRKRPESPYLVECAFLVLSRHRCRGEGGVLKKRSYWVGSVLRIGLRVPSLSARRVPLPRGTPWVARVASPGFSSQAQRHLGLPPGLAGARQSARPELGCSCPGRRELGFWCCDSSSALLGQGWPAFIVWCNKLLIPPTKCAAAGLHLHTKPPFGALVHEYRCIWCYGRTQVVSYHHPLFNDAPRTRQENR